MDERRPVVEAVATRGGRLLAVGSEAECDAALGEDDRIVHVDLRGRALLPGFNDVHLHPLPMCFFEHHLDLSPFEDLASVLDALADRAGASAPDAWVLGLQADEANLVERRLPTIDELDRLAAGRPVVLLRRDGHTTVANSAALRAAGITPDRDDPAGGRYGRDAAGRLSGWCYEAAAQLVLGAVPTPDLDDFRQAARRVFDRLSAHGLTSVGVILQTDAEGPAGAAGAAERFGMQLLLDELDQSSHAILCGQLDAVLETRSSPLHDPTAGRQVGGWKVFLDGTLGARTACLHHPYADAPDTSGMLTNDPADVARRMEQAHLAGLQICVHAIGDAANHQALDLFGELLDHHPVGHAGHGHRIEHASLLGPAEIERFAELGVSAAVQPLFLRSEHGWLGDRLGPERLTGVYPFRSLLDAGVVVAGSSDAPIEEPDALAGIHAAVDRFGVAPEQALTVEEALRLYTADAARAQRREHETGTIAEGMRADLVVLSRDPRAVTVDAVLGLTVERTIVGGRVVFEREPQAVAVAP
jgi:predicted amidohydrolase YtcJ